MGLDAERKERCMWVSVYRERRGRSRRPWCVCGRREKRDREICVCVCVCGRREKRDRKREKRDREGSRKRETEVVSACVMFVCVRCVRVWLRALCVCVWVPPVRRTHDSLILHIEMMKIVTNLNLIGTLCGSKV